MNEPIVELHAHVDIFFSNYYNLQSVYFELVRLQKKNLRIFCFHKTCDLMIFFQVPGSSSRTVTNWTSWNNRDKKAFVRTGWPDHCPTSQFDNEIGFFQEFLPKIRLLGTCYSGFDWSGWEFWLKGKLSLRREWSGRSVLTKGKRPKFLVASPCFCLFVCLFFVVTRSHVKTFKRFLLLYKKSNFTWNSTKLNLAEKGRLHITSSSLLKLPYYSRNV